MDDYYIVLIAYAVAVLIVCSVMGVISKEINESKGYYGGFAWGFWLGVIGIIVVACRADASRSSYSGSQHMSYGYSEERENPLAYSNGGWRCEFCDRANPGYKMLCDCGRSMNESNQKKARLRGEGSKQGKTVKEIQLEGAKKMFDDGLITEEEYEAKKNKILAEQKAEENSKRKKSVKEIQLEGAKKMLDDGLITEEEYEAKRKKILGI